FDQYLKGIDTDLLRDLPPVLIQDNQGNWSGLDSLSNPSSMVLYPSATGGISQAAPANGKLSLKDYPEVAKEGLPGQLVLRAQNATGLPDELVFETSPLAQDLH